MREALLETITQAKDFSLEHPENLVVVLDKKGENPTYHANKYVIDMKMMYGWHLVASYKGGEEV